MFYSFWGRFTSILSENLFFIGDFPISIWSLCISIPFLIYGLILLRLSFKKYYFVYFGSKSVKSKTFGIITIIIFAIAEILLSIFRVKYINSGIIELEMNYEGTNYSILFASIYMGYLFIRYGFLRKSVVSDLSSDRISRRLDNIEQRVQNNVQNAVQSEKRAEQERLARERRERARKQLEEEQKERLRREEKRRQEEAARRQKEQEKHRREQMNLYNKQQKEKSIKNSGTKLNINPQFCEELRPKGTALTSDDFKCIFCFRMPKLPDDKYRGIVICPNCKRPAHADEFENWARNSPLCSRCDGEIPHSFRRNPKIYTVKEYLDVAKYWISKLK